MTKAKPRKKFEQQAYDAGVEAKRAGEPDLVPTSYPAKSLQDHWLAGWRETLPAIQAAEVAPPVPQAEDARHFWPEGEPLPSVYRRSYVPCKWCRRTQLPDGSQAVRLMNTGFDGKMAYFQCSALECPGRGERWKLEVG